MMHTCIDVDVGPGSGCHLPPWQFSMMCQEMFNAMTIAAVVTWDPLTWRMNANGGQGVERI